MTKPVMNCGTKQPQKKGHHAADRYRDGQNYDSPPYHVFNNGKMLFERNWVVFSHCDEICLG